LTVPTGICALGYGAHVFRLRILVLRVPTGCGV
jgi:hypothetical protein